MEVAAHKLYLCLDLYFAFLATVLCFHYVSSFFIIISNIAMIYFIPNVLDSPCVTPCMSLNIAMLVENGFDLSNYFLIYDMSFKFCNIKVLWYYNQGSNPLFSFTPTSNFTLSHQFIGFSFFSFYFPVIFLFPCTGCMCKQYISFVSLQFSGQGGDIQKSCCHWPMRSLLHLNSL